MVGSCFEILLLCSLLSALADCNILLDNTTFLELNPDFSSTQKNLTNNATSTSSSTVASKRRKMKKKMSSKLEEQNNFSKKKGQVQPIVQDSNYRDGNDDSDDELYAPNSLTDISSDDDELEEGVELKRKKTINFLREQVITQQKLLKKLAGKVMSPTTDRKKILILVAAAGLLSSILLSVSSSTNSTNRILQRLITWENLVRVLITVQLLFRLGILNTTDDGKIRILSWNLRQNTLDAYNPPIHQNFMFEKINDRYSRDCVAIRKLIPAATSRTCRETTATATSPGGSGPMAPSSSSSSPNQKNNKVAVVLEIKADSTFTQLETFREAISFLLHTYKTNPEFQHLEIILLLESAGGLVSTYGLAAYELSRIRKEGAAAISNDNTNITTSPSISLSVCVDKVAASGGYMMACQASPGKLYAAPFAILGSIGVIGQTINVHNVLQSYGIQPLVFKSGDQKSPVGLIGEVTKEGRAKVQQSLEDIHEAFKTLVLHSREECSNLDIDKVSTGDIWLGREAVELGLADRIMSSQEYIAHRIQEGDTVLQLKSYQREPPFASFFRSTSSRSPTRPYPFMKAISLAAESIVSNVVSSAQSSIAAVECDPSIMDKLETRSFHAHTGLQGVSTL
jgi:ClpP class serine protease